MAECGWEDFPRIVGVVSGQAARPIPALPPSLFVPHHKENAKSGRRRARIAVRTKKSLGFPPPLPPPSPPFATHHNDRCALPVQQNATKCIGRGGGLSHSGATRQMSQFFAAGVESAKQQLVREVGCGKIQLSQVSLIHKEGLLLTLAGGALTG